MELYILRDEIAWIIVTGVISFYILSQSSQQTLLAIMVISLFGYVSYVYLTKKSNDISAEIKRDEEVVNADGKKRVETSNEIYPVAKFPKKGFRYLKENDEFKLIAKNLVILRMFDKGRYADLLLYLDQLQKTYMYILDGRYGTKSHVPIFMDLREKIQEILYSLIFVLPKKLKHVYGVNPHSIMEESIELFTVKSRKMLDVLRNFSRMEKKDPYFPETLPQPADKPFHYIKQRILP